MVTTTKRQSGSVHFTVGEDLGLRIMEIAQEHLTERNNPIQALKTITDSLMGCPVDIAVKILKGDLVLPVDVESQEVICQERIVGIHDRFPKINPVFFIESKCDKIKLHGGYIIEGIKDLQYQIKIKNRGYINIEFKYEDIFKFIAGDNEILLDELRENREIDGIANLFETAKRFIEETMKMQATMEWIVQTFDEFKKESNNEIYIQLKGDVADTLEDISYNLNQTIKLNFVLDAPADNVQQYIDASREIDTVLSEGIKPVNIMDNYSAGWLSPEGVFYGLNGEIANMLHIQIADALFEANVIPSDYNEIALNTSQWLEIAGWVKIHNCNVQFAGCLNKKESVTNSMPNVNMTNVQAEIIFKYLHELHGDVCKLGWRMTPITAHMFLRLSDNPELMNEKYFEF
jgi:hypothetical protein